MRQHLRRWMFAKLRKRNRCYDIIKSILIIFIVRIIPDIIVKRLLDSPPDPWHFRKLNRALKDCMVTTALKPCIFVNYKRGDCVCLVMIDQTIVKQRFRASSTRRIHKSGEETFSNRKSVNDQQVHFIQEGEELGCVVVVIGGVTIQPRNGPNPRIEIPHGKNSESLLSKPQRFLSYQEK